MAEVFVLRSEDPQRAVAFFEKMGLSFVKEKHGNGPTHWACDRQGDVFEIYPKIREGFLD